MTESENQPPSQWLEETLIELYLAGYPDSTSMENDVDQLELEASDVPAIGDSINDENSLDDALGEDSWRAQYGQVGESGNGETLDFPVIDLFDWSVVKDLGREREHHLVGRLIKKSSKLHPSVRTGTGPFKTAAICEKHLDLVRVSSGRVYRLRSPNALYLASVVKYDSSNPTESWDFPDLYESLCKRNHSRQYPARNQQEPRELDQNTKINYRDRAAERRKLHAGFGVGPGQKSGSRFILGDDESSSVDCEEPASEPKEIQYGAGKRILMSMGWKEGESVGKTRNGLIDPLQPVGNVGSTSLG